MATNTTHRASRVSTVPPNETKRERFVRLANGRVRKALKAIEQLHPLFNSSQYESTLADWDKVQAALYKWIDAAAPKPQTPKGPDFNI